MFSRLKSKHLQASNARLNAETPEADLSCFQVPLVASLANERAVDEEPDCVPCRFQPIRMPLLRVEVRQLHALVANVHEERVVVEARRIVVPNHQTEAGDDRPVRACCLHLRLRRVIARWRPIWDPYRGRVLERMNAAADSPTAVVEKQIIQNLPLGTCVPSRQALTPIPNVEQRSRFGRRTGQRCWSARWG